MTPSAENLSFNERRSRTVAAYRACAARFEQRAMDAPSEGDRVGLRGLAKADADLSERLASDETFAREHFARIDRRSDERAAIRASLVQTEAA